MLEQKDHRVAIKKLWLKG